MSGKAILKEIGSTLLYIVVVLGLRPQRPPKPSDP